MKLNLSYQQVHDAVTNHHTQISAAEAHGILTGMLCVHGNADGRQWLAVLFDADELPDSGTDKDLLLDLCEQTRQALRDDDFAFELLLPDDDADLSERALALGEWCQGFLYGVGYQTADAEWPGESGEVLRDLLEIARLDADADGEADEAAFMEINEFVRIAVQMIQGEFKQQAQSTRLH